MATYKCLIIDSAGKKDSTIIEADNKQMAAQLASIGGKFVLSVEENVHSKEINFKKNNKKISSKELAIFCRQMNAMLSAGVTISNCLEIMKKQTENKTLERVLTDIRENIQKGLTLSEAVQQHSNVFPEIFIHMVEAGEVSGNLDIIMDRLANNFDKDYKLESKVKNAMVYPAVLAGLCIVVVIFLLVFVLPTFIDIYEGSGAQLPLITRMFINTSDFVRHQWYIVIALVACIVAIWKVLCKDENFGIRKDKFKLNVPIFKKVNTNAPAAKFARTMSTLMGSGVSLIQAIDISARVAGNKYISNNLVKAKEEVKKGVALSVPLKDFNIFPTMLCSMIKVGEDSGTLEEILDKTASFYEGEVDNSVTRLTAVLEPIMIILMAVIVGFIVLAMVVPMFDMFNVIA